MHGRPIESQQSHGVRISGRAALSPWRLLLVAVWVELRALLP
ncbi:hypothetical protein [Saccharopolyspora taberi]